MADTKITFNAANIFLQNTPSILNKVGNIFLLIATIGAAAAIAPISTPTIAAIGAWSAFAGAIGKILTKATGEVPK